MNQPDFIIIGAPKGGTTSLYHYLRQHPQIFMGILKDSHFFLHDGASPVIGGPFDRQRQREMIKTWADYRKQFRAPDSARVKGEAGEPANPALRWFWSASRTSRVVYMVVLALFWAAVLSGFSVWLALLADARAESGAAMRVGQAFAVLAGG